MLAAVSKDTMGDEPGLLSVDTAMGMPSSRMRATGGFNGLLLATLVNAEVPSYFYALLAINRLVMPVKKRPADGAIPDCRPVGVPQPDRCCIERAVAKTAEEAHAAYLAPEQLGVGVKGGIALLVHGLRLLLEAHPEFVFVSLDTRNAHNEFDRESFTSYLYVRLCRRHPVNR